MAIVNIPELNQTISDSEAVARHLASLGIDYERWNPSHPVTTDASAEEILAAYASAGAGKKILLPFSTDVKRPIDLWRSR